jgi:hypothetical protein
MTKQHQLIKDQEFKDYLKYAKPARRLRKGRYGAHIVHFPSLKNDRTIVCESTIEADFALRLEHMPNVIGYLAQPETFTFWIDGEKSTYTPDFLVYFRHKDPIYIEVKPDDWEIDEALIAQLASYQRVLSKQGHKLQIVSSSEIRIDPLISNLQRIYARIHQVSQNAIEHLSNCLIKTGGKSTIRELRDLDNPPIDQAVMHALFHGPVNHINQRSLNTDFIVELI